MSAENTWVKSNRKIQSLSALFEIFAGRLGILVIGFIEEILLAALIYALFQSARPYS